MLGGGNSWSGPSFDLNLFIVVAALVFATGWLLVAVARLQSAYQAGIRNTTSLKRQQINEAKEMMKLTQEALRLEGEIKEARAAAEKTAKELEERRKMLGEQPVATARPTEVFVASEFASSKKEKPWIAHMKRTGANRARRPGEAATRFVLLWAADHPAALGRARGLVASDTDYEVEGLRPFASG